jgi:uncharacterized protein YjbI with pentapeptide repeats
LNAFWSTVNCRLPQCRRLRNIWVAKESGYQLWQVKARRLCNMANEEHLKLINQGVEAWNSWRENTSHAIPDLSSAELNGASLRRSDLRDVDLSNAQLIGVDLSDANLQRANLYATSLAVSNLSRADLRGANLRRSTLSEANLWIADLAGASLAAGYLYAADLSGAHLRGADLRGADLRSVFFDSTILDEADLTGAVIAGTTFCNIDLSTVRGLETINHFGPSTIGIDTLFRSDGEIPEVFLREAGVPEDFITFIPSLVGRAIEFYSSFISYSHEDEQFSRRLHSRMRSEKLRVWYAPEDMKAGRKLHEEIFRAIQVHDKLLLVLSHASMESEWVMSEIKRAKKVERKESRRKLFPIRLVDFQTIENWECFDADSGKDLAAEIREYYIPDFSNWKDNDSFEIEFSKLLRDLRATER